MKLILLSPENNFPDEYGILKELLNNGLEKLHVRKPFFSREETLIAYIEKIPSQHYSKLVLHTHHDLAIQ